jgi:hypothetical protein
MIRDGLKRQRIVAVPESFLDVALLDVGVRRAPQPGGLEQGVVEGRAIVERPAASIEAFLPLAEVIGGGAHMPKGTARWPEIMARF